MTDNLYREIHLENGLTVRVFDSTKHYFGDYYRVILTIVCEVPVANGGFTTPEELEEARCLVGDWAVYRRTLQQMGVPSTEIPRARERLIADFVEHSLPYFAAADFPHKLVRREFSKLRAKLARTQVV